MVDKSYYGNGLKHHVSSYFHPLPSRLLFNPNIVIHTTPTQKVAPTSQSNPFLTLATQG